MTCHNCNQKIEIDLREYYGSIPFKCPTCHALYKWDRGVYGEFKQPDGRIFIVLESYGQPLLVSQPFVSKPQSTTHG